MSRSIETPCVQVCVVNHNRTVCIGCGRTLGEIREWRVASESRKAEIVQHAAERLQTTIKVSYDD